MNIEEAGTVRPFGLLLRRTDFSFEIRIKEFATQVGSAGPTPEHDDRRSDKYGGVSSDHHSDHDREGEVF